MKKAFMIATACISGIILIFIVVMGFAKRNVNISYTEPETINVYYQSSNPTKQGGYNQSDENYDSILKNLSNITNMSMLEWLFGCNSITTEVTQDLNGQFSQTYKPDFLQTSVGVELVFPKEQDVVVKIGNDTKVLSFWCLMYIIPLSKTFTDIIVYFSTTSDSTKRIESYQTYRPMALKGNTKNFCEYVSRNLVQK